VTIVSISGCPRSLALGDRGTPKRLNRLRHWKREFGQVREPVVHDLVGWFPRLYLLLQVAENGAVLRKLSPVQVQLLDLGGILVDEFVEGVGRLHDSIFTRTRRGSSGNLCE
jgi:hypothetical protein